MANEYFCTAVFRCTFSEEHLIEEMQGLYVSDGGSAAQAFEVDEDKDQTQTTCISPYGFDIGIAIKRVNGNIIHEIDFGCVPLIWGRQIDLSKGKYKTPEETLAHISKTTEHETFIVESVYEGGPFADVAEAEEYYTIAWTGVVHMKSEWAAPIDLMKAVSQKNPEWDIELFFSCIEDDVTDHVCFKAGEVVPSWLGLDQPLNQYFVD